MVSGRCGADKVVYLRGFFKVCLVVIREGLRVLVSEVLLVGAYLRAVPDVKGGALASRANHLKQALNIVSLLRRIETTLVINPVDPALVAVLAVARVAFGHPDAALRAVEPIVDLVEITVGEGHCAVGADVEGRHMEEEEGGREGLKAWTEGRKAWAKSAKGQWRGVNICPPTPPPPKNRGGVGEFGRSRGVREFGRNQPDLVTFLQPERLQEPASPPNAI